jgi:hypothetical protein
VSDEELQLQAPPPPQFAALLAHLREENETEAGKKRPRRTD